MPDIGRLLDPKLTLASLRRIGWTVVMIVSTFWIITTTYHEWQVMRMVKVMTEQMRQTKPQAPQFNLPVDDSSTRA